VDIKVPPHAGGDLGPLHAFYRAAQIIAQLDHPCIAPVYGLADPAATGAPPVLVVKPRTGMTLRTFIHAAQHHVIDNPDHPLPPDLRLCARLLVFLKAGEGLAHAHHRGVVHNHLRPDCIQVGSHGQVTIHDWSRAALFGNGGVDLTADGLAGVVADPDAALGAVQVPAATPGDPGYMAP
jgi:serine/threonine protein kinase